MQDYQERVIEEKAELDIKRDKLRKFIMSGEKFNEVNPREQSHMVGQLQLMNQYSDVLARRIEGFKEKP